MSSIESRIVTMKFDNAAFARGVTSTMDLLSKLKTSLSGLGSYTSKGLDAIGSAASKANLAPLGAQADEIGNRFTAMSVVAITAIASIAHAALNSATQIAKSFTISPITSGLDEYETNLNSIQTILANTGLEGKKGLEQVNGALAELNAYSDKTIYNFSEMARNIGTFTAAGVKLDTATQAIKGIANLAAVSGSNSQQASTAMYQLSQALATGTVKLMDWNSVNAAGMGGKLFQESLKETARVHGVAVDDIIKDEGSFRDSLQRGWLTADVLNETLMKFAGDLSEAQLKARGYSAEQIKDIIKLGKTATDAATKVKTMSQLMSTLRESAGSGWAKTWQLIFGDFGEAKQMWTRANDTLSGIIHRMSKSRNDMLKDWNELGGRTVAISAVSKAFKALLHLLQPIRRAFRDVFPATTGKNLYDITLAIRHFMKTLVMQGHTMHDVRTIFHAFFGVIGVGVEIIKGVIHYITSLIGLLSGGTGGVLDFSASIAEIVVQLTDWILKGDYIAKFFDKIIAGRAALLKPIIEYLSKLLHVLAGFIGNGADLAIDAVTAALKFLTPVIQEVISWMDRAGSAVRDGFISQLKELEPVARAVGDWLSRAGDVIRDKFLAAIDQLAPMFQKIKNAIADAFGSLSGIGGTMGGALGGLASMFNIGDSTDAAASGIDKVKDALSLAGPAAQGAKDGMSGFASFLMAMGGVLASVGSWIWDVLVQIKDDVAETFSDLGAGGGAILSGIKGFFGYIKDSIFGLFEGLSFGEIVVMLNTIFFTGIMFSIQRFIFQIGGIFKDMRGVFQSASGIFDQVTSNLKTMQRDVQSNILLKIAIALGILAAALYVISTIDTVALGNALGALAAMLIMLVGAMTILTKTLPDAGAIKEAFQLGALSLVLLGLGAAMLLMAGAVYILGQMKPDELKKGLLSITVILATVTAAAVALNKSGGGKAILAASFALGVLAVALIALAGAIKLYSAIDINTIFEGGGKIALIIGAIGLAMRAFPEAGAMAAAGAMLVMSAALVIIAKALQMVAKLSAGDSAQTIITLALALDMLAATAMLMEAAMPGAQAMLVMAAALVVMAKAMQMFAALDWQDSIQSLLLLAGVFTAIGLASFILAPLVPVIAALGAAILILGAGMALAGAGMFLFSAGLVMLAATGSAGVVILIDAINTFLEAIPGFIQRLGASFIAMANQIRKTGPAFIQAFGVILRSLLNEVIKTIPKIGQVFRALIAEGLKTLRAAIPDMIRTGFAILMAFLRGLASNMAAITQKAVDIIVTFIRGITKNMDRIVDAGYDLVVKFVKAVASNIWEKATYMWEQAKLLGSSIWQGVKAGIEAGLQFVKDAAVNLATSALHSAMDALHINSPSKVFRDIVGRAIPEGMAAGIDNNAHLASKSAKDMAMGAIKEAQSSMSKMHEAVSGELDIDPTISPVLDLSKVQKSASAISAMLASNPLNADVSYQQASQISSEQQAAAQLAAEMSDGGGVTEIKFEQHNNSPKALSAVEIYRNTKSQLSLAKEALKV